MSLKPNSIQKHNQSVKAFNMKNLYEILMKKNVSFKTMINSFLTIQKKIILIFFFYLIYSGCTKEITNNIPLSPDTQPGTINGEGRNQTPNQSQASPEGVISSGGGKGVACQTPAGTTVTLLDLYEAEHLYKFKIDHNPQTEDEAIDIVAKLFSKHYFQPYPGQSSTDSLNFGFQSYVEILKYFKDEIIFINEATQSLNDTKDSYEPLVEKNCEVVQIANYFNDTTLLVNPKYWNLLNPLNKAALLLHEYIYKFQRSRASATNSIQVRKVIGHLLSSKDLEPRMSGLPDDWSNTYRCYITYNDFNIGTFYMFPSFVEKFENQKEWTPQVIFRRLPGNPLPLFKISTYLETDLSIGLNKPEDFEKFNQLFKSYMNGQVSEKMGSVDIFSEGELKYTNFSIKIVEPNKGQIQFHEFKTNDLSPVYDFSCKNFENY